MDNMLHSFLSEMIGRIDGPMRFRLILQPAIAIYFAYRHGRKDALARRAPYAWAVLHDPAHRLYLLEDGWKDFGKVFLLAYALDLFYQYLALGSFRLAQAFAVACLLAMVPYLAVRGPVNRLWRAIDPQRTEGTHG